MTPLDRFMEKVVRTKTCWDWAGTRTRGYGMFWFDGRMRLAHRWLYETVVGPVPNGLELDHLCRNRGCVNPRHLEAVTRSENSRRGETGRHSESKVTHCPRGHEYAGGNLRVRRGKRECRACDRLAHRRRREFAVQTTEDVA